MCIRDRKEKLEQMRTDFLSNVSHELKTPIALIQGYAEGLKEGITDDPESMDCLLYTSRNVATKLIEDFMLAANETVAEDYFWQEVPFIYRTHENPDPEKILKLSTCLLYTSRCV